MMTMRPEAADRLWAIARPLGWLSVAFVLLAPAVAMRFTSQVQWTSLDFAFAGVLLIGGGALCEAFAWRVRNSVARIAFSLAIVLLVALVWAASIS